MDLFPAPVQLSGLRPLHALFSLFSLRPLRGNTLRPLLLAALLVPALAQVAQADDGEVTALGRLEPSGGVIRVAGPSHMAVVITELHVAEGDALEKGQLIARLDTYARHRATVSARVAELEEAERELARSAKLQAGRAASQAARDTSEMKVKVAKARLAGARAELALSEVMAPTAGRVLAIHAHDGERVGADGILELGQTDEMYAVAEVYETDIGRVREGQVASITSAALASPLTGVVERIGLMVAKMDVLGTDPVAKTDARVIEVDIRLDEGQDVSKLTYLQVTVEIKPD
jgi:HlyD family secretion protein